MNKKCILYSTYAFDNRIKLYNICAKNKMKKSDGKKRQLVISVYFLCDTLIEFIW